MASSEASRIAICVATYMRPKGLGKLLDSLRHIDTTGFAVFLLVADNDANGSALDVFESHTIDFPYPVKYLIEPQRGIATVRNRLFAEAYSLGADFIASTDDDATVDRKWIQELMNSALFHKADAVAGAVTFWADYDAPSFVRSYLAPPLRHQTTQTTRISTNNALVRTSAALSIPGPFDTRYNISGGSDSALSEALLDKGYKIVYHSDAMVYEYFPKSRARVKYLLRRGYTNGGTESRIRLSKSRSPFTIVALLLRFCGRIAISSIAVVWSLLWSRDETVRHCVRIAYGTGGIAAMLSSRAILRHYDKIHGE